MSAWLLSTSHMAPIVERLSSHFRVACNSINTLFRNAGPSSGRSVMLLFILLSNLALIVIHFIAILNRVETALAWVQALMSLILASWSEMLFRQGPSVVA